MDDEMSTTSAKGQLTEADIKDMVAEWYKALDEHRPLTHVEEFLVADGPRMTFPERATDTMSEFREWYDDVTRKFFDESHRVDKVEVEQSGDVAAVHVVVTWHTRTWTPPEARSSQLSFEADQTWEVVSDASGKPRIKTYVVNDLRPL